MRLVWVVIPLVLIGIIGISESFAEETKTIFIDSHLVDCVSVAPQKCMLVSENPNSEWSYFYGNIEGFTFVEGNTYQLLVKITHIENPPADSSSKKYELLEIITKNSFAEIDSPRKQRANGVAVENIICKEGLGLIFKSSDDSPACVKVKTAEKLIQRGWANP